MTINDAIIDGIENDIKEILFAYLKAESFTNTAKEKEAEKFFLDYFSKIPYFKNTPDSFGAYPIDNDVFDRSVSYAFLKGEGKDTVVFVHHNDVVSVEDFKLLKDFAFSPDELKEELLKIKDTLGENAQKDLTDDTFLFGRGVCDMKGGGSIQIALLKRYSELKNFKGNIVLIAVPDEENLSAGMRSAVKLLYELKEKHQLNYRIMINSEPHQRKDFSQGIFSEGSVGKLMPFVYVRGALAHAGKVFEGLNPLNIMSCIVRKTELNMRFSDIVKGETSPPPTWLYLRDGKNKYDVSMPLSVKGCFSILTLHQTPQSILEEVKYICAEAFDEVIKDMNKSHVEFTGITKIPYKKLPWETKVANFSELYQEAKEKYGKKFTEKYSNKMDELSHKFKYNEISMIEANFDLIELIYEYIDDVSPRIIYGLIPPYYPNTSNINFDSLDTEIKNISEELNKFTKEQFDQTYTKEYFYTGISDLSYTGIVNGQEIISALRLSMPLYGKLYDIPVDTIEKISMPCINIGPWGKDFHKLTERVFNEDLYIRTPRILNHAVCLILNNK
ncbi:M20/M25/M40 family metallo-hydrolase [Sedimentibacter hydroxybenzoicus DSM 7310]|uniref:M20/M25/M40 family metallo-hydrolase n=1 Tax=Sedimentibacter hydroxybenzoicus DSM 7310 TaxID=1123245 RepID=A0A974BGX7_SEDHY|nr:M20/M25/M40 family metallo-hydrolase [Sedimentibacter hydroxybenzoicus]NYB72647.1 M20/M25/M40 family metallo-hydrolase [Sedimentibacter hydroxybenzoicus DSM 7310]